MHDQHKVVFSMYLQTSSVDYPGFLISLNEVLIVRLVQLSKSTLVFFQATKVMSDGKGDFDREYLMEQLPNDLIVDKDQVPYLLLSQNYFCCK